MELTRQDLIEILRIVEQADVEFLQIEAGDNRLTLSKNGAFLGGANGVQEAPRAAEPARAQPAPQRGSAAPAKAPAATGPPEVPEGCVTVTAPTLGVFYRRPEPGAQPFVEVGSQVAAGATLGLIEVMKVFNAVASPVDGVVEAVLVEDEQLVEYAQPLIAVRETERPGE